MKRYYEKGSFINTIPKYKGSPLKENQIKLKSIPYSNQQCYRTETDPEDQYSIMPNIQSQIMNEILNQDSSLQYELEQINNKIEESQFLMKEKIQSLLNINKQNFKDRNLSKIYKELQRFQDNLNKIESEKQILQKETKEQIKKLEQLTLKEKNLCTLQKEISKKQNSAYDYFEQEFNQLKTIYQDLTQNSENIDQKGRVEQYNQLLESKALLKEDLNGKLLQRAELVAQKEDYDQILEHYQSTNQEIFELLFGQLSQVEKIKTIDINIEQNKRDYDRLAQVKEDKLIYLMNQEQIYEFEQQQLNTTQKIKSIKSKLELILKNINLPHPDKFHNDFVYQWNGQDLQKKLNIFLYNQKAIYFKTLQGSKIPMLNEYFEYLEQYIFIRLVNEELIQQIQELKSYLHFGQISQEDIPKIDFELQLLTQEIVNLENQKQNFNQNINLDSLINQHILERTKNAYQRYTDENEENFREIYEEYGQEQCQKALDEGYQQFLRLVSEQEYQKIESLKKIIEKIEYQDRIINFNIQYVDDDILIKLKENSDQLQQLKFTIDKNVSSQQVQQVKKQIETLELKFKDQIQSFQNEESTCQIKLQDLQQNIGMINQQLQQNQLRLHKYNQEFGNISNQHNYRIGTFQTNKLESQLKEITGEELEKDIIEINNTIMKHQYDKRKIENVIKQSPQKSLNLRSAVGNQVSKSLNSHQFNNRVCKEIENEYLLKIGVSNRKKQQKGRWNNI